VLDRGREIGALPGPERGQAPVEEGRLDGEPAAATSVDRDPPKARPPIRQGRGLSTQGAGRPARARVAGLRPTAAPAVDEPRRPGLRALGSCERLEGGKVKTLAVAADVGQLSVPALMNPPDAMGLLQMPQTGSGRSCCMGSL
jgi:hypothetical protein